MSVTGGYVKEIFKGLESGDGGAFFAHVADDGGTDTPYGQKN